MNLIFVTESPLLHLHSNSRLLSKFQGPFCLTHFSWYLDPNLNYRTLFPTSTIWRFEPIFHDDLIVFFNALWFWFLSIKRWPKSLREHSSSRSNLHFDFIEISSSSFLISQRLSNPSTTIWSMEVMGEKESQTLGRKPRRQTRGRKNSDERE